MTIKHALDWAIKKLAGVQNFEHQKGAKYCVPALDVEILLSFVLKKDKTFLFAHPEKKLTKIQLEKFKKLITRRAKHEPIAYITNNKEFCGLDFYVDRNVLIPRPETELMVDEAIKILITKLRKSQNYEKINLLDVGAGSGCILISIAKTLLLRNLDGRPNFSANQIKQIKIFALDSSKAVLKIARKNASKFGVHPVRNKLPRAITNPADWISNGAQQKIKFLHGNLLEPLFAYSRELENAIITANLPYLTSEQYKKLSPDIKKYEPKSALVGGKDGLKYYRGLLKELDSRFRGNDKGKSRNNIWALFEIDPSQTKSIKKLIKTYFKNAKIEIKKDLAKRDRLVIVKI